MKKPHFKLKTPQGNITFKSEDLTSHIAVSQQFLNGFGGWLPNPDPILRKMGKHIHVYRELLRDELVGSFVRRRKAAVARLDWKLNNIGVDNRVIELIENWLKEDIDIYRLCKDIMNAVFFGYQPIEVIWQHHQQWLPSAVIAKPQEWFGFNDKGELIYLQNTYKDHHESLPSYKFLCPKHEDDYLNPYGLGDLGLVFWLVTFKRGGMKFWVQFTEKYGAPWLIGKEPRSNTQADTNKLLDALEALISNSVGTIPNDSSVEIHEASGKSSSVDAYDKLLKECKSGINIALLGQDQTTDKETNHASATAGLQIADDIRDSDRRLVESTFNQLIKWVVELNFGEVKCPKFELFENEESGTKERAERDSLLSNAGVKFTAQYWQREYGLEDGDILLENVNIQPIQTATTNFSEFNSTKKQDLSDKLSVLMPNATALNRQSDAMWSVIAEYINNVKDEDELLEALSAAYPHMNTDELEDELSRILFISSILSRLNTESELQA